MYSTVLPRYGYRSDRNISRYELDIVLNNYLTVDAALLWWRHKNQQKVVNSISPYVAKAILASAASSERYEVYITIHVHKKKK